MYDYYKQELTYNNILNGFVKCGSWEIYMLIVNPQAIHMNNMKNSCAFPSRRHAYTFIYLYNDLCKSKNVLQSDRPVYDHGFLNTRNCALLTGDEQLIAIQDAGNAVRKEAEEKLREKWGDD